MTAFIIIAIELALIFEAIRRIRILSAPHIVMLYCMAAQMVFYNADALRYYEVAGPESLLSYQTEGMFGLKIYLIIFLIAYTSTAGYKIPRADIRTTLINLLTKNDGIIEYATRFILGYTIIHLVLIDYENLWFHPDYSTTGLRFDGGVFPIFSRLRPLIAMACIVLMQLSFFTGMRVRFSVLLALSVWHFLIPFTGASRYAVVLIFASGAAAMMFAQRGRLIIGIAHSLLGFLVLQAMIFGRSGTEFGLVAIPTLVLAMFDSDPYSRSMGLFNLFQGITVTIDGLLTAPQYSWKYAYLSISPLPASIDGFDTVLATDEFRLSIFVPMSSIAEAYLFGWPIFPIVVFVFFFSLRATLSVAQIGHQIWSLLSSIFLAAMFVMANAYPLRNTFRQFLLILIINYTLIFIARHKIHKNKSTN